MRKIQLNLNVDANRAQLDGLTQRDRREVVAAAQRLVDGIADDDATAELFAELQACATKRGDSSVCVNCVSNALGIAFILGAKKQIAVSIETSRELVEQHGAFDAVDA